MSGYEDAFDAVLDVPDLSAEEHLNLLVQLILDDIATKKTTRIFPEIWAMANRDPFVQERVDELYRRARVALERLIGQMNPDLPDDERAVLALFISASLEGMTPIAGYSKAWNHELDALKILAVKSFVLIISSLKAGDIRRTLPPLPTGAKKGKNRNQKLETR